MPVRQDHFAVQVLDGEQARLLHEDVQTLASTGCPTNGDLMYTDREVMAAAVRMAAKQRVDMRHLQRNVDIVMSRKSRKPLTARDAAMVAVERTATSIRRLAHETGAEGWV